MRKSYFNNQCSFVMRVSVHPSVKVGGFALGRCERVALPEMTVCVEHADKEAMAMVIRYLAAKLEHPLKGKGAVNEAVEGAEASS